MNEKKIKSKILAFLAPYYVRNKIKTAEVLAEIISDFEEVEVTQENFIEFKERFKRKFKERK